MRTRWYWRGVIVFFALLGATSGLVGPFFQKVFIDQILGHSSTELPKGHEHWVLELMHQAESVSPVWLISGAFLATLLAQACSLIGGYIGVREGMYLQSLFGERLYRKMLAIRPDTMGSTTVGEIVSIYATDVAGSTTVVDQTLPMGAGVIFSFTIAPIAASIICGIPVWATLSIVLAVVALNTILGTRQARFFHNFKQLAAERTGIVNEWIQNIRLLRILGWIENFEARILRKRVEETKNRVSMVTNGQMMGAFGSSISFVINLVGVAALVRVSEARGQSVSPGQLFSLLWIFGVFLQRPFRQIPWLFTFTLDGLSSMRRIERFLDRQSDEEFLDETPALHAGAAREATRKALSVSNLNLTIGEKAILQDISLEVNQGEFVAIVGEVGSGKSLLILSLLGETGASFDHYRLFELNAKAMSLDERRRFFGFVAQDGFVMSATLRENIVFRYLGHEQSIERNDENILSSLERAQFRLGSGDSEFTGSQGLATEIGERGVNLSGGQRQRVALARADYLDRSILLLDDCLSAVDVDTERKLISTLIGGAWKNKARLLVTHRLSVLEKVDRVLFLEDGKIVENGKFSDLLARSEKVRAFVASVRRTEAFASPEKESPVVVEIDPEAMKGADNVEGEGLS